MPNVFISYSRADCLEFAQELHRRLVRDGVECFLDKASIDWGENWELALETAVRDCDHVLVVLSPGYVTSEWAQLERTAAMLEDPNNVKRKLLPLLRRACHPAAFLQTLQSIDVSSDSTWEANYPKICVRFGGTVRADMDPDILAQGLLPPVVSLPPKHRMPYASLQNRFCGRIQALHNLHQALTESGDTAVISGVGVVAGTGGLGKTQLAVEYVHRFANFYTGGIYWVDAEQPIERAAQELAFALEVSVDDTLPPERQMESIWQLLANTPANVLVVFDNFPEEGPLRPWLPAATTSIKTIVTTRRRDLEYADVPLMFLSHQESLDLLNAADRQFGVEANELIEALGGLPLALELARSFLNRRNELSIADVLTEIEEQGTFPVLEVFADKYRDQLPTGHELAVGATFMLSWQMATPAQQSLMMQIASLAPAPVPRSLLTVENAGASSLDDPLAEALLELNRLALLEFSETNAPQLHRLMRDFVREQFKEEAIQKSLNSAISAISTEIRQASLNPDKSTIDYIEQIAIHAHWLIDAGKVKGQDLIPIANKLQVQHQVLGRYAQANEIGGIALENAKQVYDKAHKEIAILQSNRALVLKELGKLEEAKALLSAALESDLHNFGPGHPTVARDQANLALVLKSMGHLDEARALLTEALTSAETTFEPGHSTISTRQSNLALVLQELGELEQAKDLLSRALAADQLSFEPEHPSIAIRQSNLASVLKELGELAQAKDLLLKTLASAIATFEPGHPTIATRQSNLAMVLKDLGELTEARDLLYEALASAEITFEPRHPTIATRQNNLAMVLKEQGELEQAKGLAEVALTTLRDLFGIDHRSTEAAASNLEEIIQELSKQ